MIPEGNRTGRKPKSLVERAAEHVKRNVFNPARWAVVGAASLVAGCGDRERENQPKETTELRSFDFGNSFPVDLATLEPQAKQDIQQQVGTFLAEHDSAATFSELQHSRIVIEVSSDERPTKAWGDKGNEALSEARLKELDQVIRETLDGYAFALEIPAAKVKAFKRKTFTRHMPAGEWGVGVTPLTRLINPDTGEYYKDTEIRKLPRTTREQLFDQARYAKVRFELPGENEKTEQYDQLLEIMAGYDNVTLLMDRSGSMRDDYWNLSQSFETAYTHRQTDFASDTSYVVTFESDADLAPEKPLQTVAPDQVGEYIRRLPSIGQNERLFRSLQTVIDRKLATPEAAKRRAIVVFSDEGIQDFSEAEMTRIVDECAANQLDVYFALIAQNALITFVDQKGLQYEYQSWVAGEGAGQVAKQVQLDEEGNVVFLTH